MNKEILHRSIDLLSRREHSIQELTQKLSRKDFIRDEISVVIDYLIANNYLSNERFTESVIRSRVNKGYGLQYIRHELAHKGVDNHLVSSILSQQEIDWYQLAEQAYRKRFGYKPIKDQKDKAKRLRFLQYRGYSIDESLTAIASE